MLFSNSNETADTDISTRASTIYANVWMCVSPRLTKKKVFLLKIHENKVLHAGRERKLMAIVDEIVIMGNLRTKEKILRDQKPTRNTPFVET